MGEEGGLHLIGWKRCNAPFPIPYCKLVALGTSWILGLDPIFLESRIDQRQDVANLAFLPPSHTKVFSIRQQDTKACCSFQPSEPEVHMGKETAES